MNQKRSRSLWDEARKPNASTSATVRAILYELQPIRFSTVDMKPWLLKARQSMKFIQSSIPLLVRSLISVIRKLNHKQWLVLISVWLYWQLVKWIHRYVVSYDSKINKQVLFAQWMYHMFLPAVCSIYSRTLDAGPIFIMATIMLLIFTIGLGDREKTDEEYWSAYSVFNRGCQSLLGAINADDLVAQHVGGGWNMGFRAAHQNNNNNNDDDDDMDQHGRVQDRRRRLDPPHDDANLNPAELNAPPIPNQARKSGKKLRRKNLEQRKEAQRQRQAATELGFGGLDETEAMNRLIEEQAAAIQEMDENDDDGNMAAILAALED